MKTSRKSTVLASALFGLLAFFAPTVWPAQYGLDLRQNSRTPITVVDDSNTEVKVGDADNSAIRVICVSGCAFGSGGGVDIKDEGGSSLGTATVLDCVGGGITCTFSSGTGTLTVNASGANTALSNLASVSINTSLLAQSDVDLGSSSAPFRSGFLSATSADAVGAKLNLYKSRSGGVITTADVLGDLDFYGHDGSNQLLMGRIRSVSTGTIASTRVPTALEFYTATNAAPSVLTKALTLGSDQSATFAGALSVAGTGSHLHVFSGAANSTQTWRLHAGSTSNEYFQIQSATAGHFFYAAAGSGTARSLFIGTNNTAAITINTSQSVLLTPAANAIALQSTGYSITGSGTTSMIDLAGTLNTSGVTDVIKADITNTASGAGSTLLNLKVGGTSQFSVGTGGNVISTGSFKSGAPSGGTAQPWKFGTVASVTPTAQNRTIEVEINGTTYYITAKTTND